MEKNNLWIYGEFVLKRWGINDITLETIVMDYGLPIYNSNNESENVEDGITSYLERYKFKLKMTSKRCPHINEDQNEGSNNNLSCSQCKLDDACLSSGTTMTVQWQQRWHGSQSDDNGVYNAKEKNSGRFRARLLFA